MNIGLIGFGRTGKAVASMLLESKVATLCWVLRKSRTLEHRSVPEFFGVESDEPGLIYSTEDVSVCELLDMYPVDAIVDFSSDEGLNFYGEEAATRGIAIVSAISNYSKSQKEKLRTLSQRTRVVHSPNITVGINFLLVAAKILRRIAPYTDIEIVEEHFKLKSDVSGTAKIIAMQLNVDESAIKTVRAGGIIGTHEILFGFPYQTVRLKHESISREAFGNGILFVLNNLPIMERGMFSMEDILEPYFHVKDHDVKKNIECISLW